MSAHHSPAPWALNVDTMDIESSEVDFGDDGQPQVFYSSICTMSGGRREQEDARLIAVSPELLSQLIQLRDAADHLLYCPRDDLHEASQALTRAIAEATSVIAKAGA